MKVDIRPADSDDADVIVAFNEGLARETEDKALDLRVLREGVNALLSDPDKGKYFLAVIDGRIVGQIMITHEWSDWRNGDFWWLQSVYVAPEARKQGVFRRLLEHIREEAERDPSVCGMRLYVDQNNKAAQSIYKASEFAPGDYRVMALEFSNRDNN